MFFRMIVYGAILAVVPAADGFAQVAESEPLPQSITLNQKDTGYRSIWYMNQPSHDQYVYKYSGGLGTYCAKHRPFAIYRPEVNKTFFCYGGTTADEQRHLLHMVSYFDHETKQVPRPTILLDKQTDDAHDNPVISMDAEGFIWIFSTSHGTSRPSYIHRSVRPYDIQQFELVSAVRIKDDQLVPIDNFSYMQIWFRKDHGFSAFFTRYGYPAARTICFMRSDDGMQWSPWQRIAAIHQGHYQISAVGKKVAGTMFNYHPDGKGLNWRTNLYYVQTKDDGHSWTNVQGVPLALPLTSVENMALVRNYEAEGLNVYLKDVQFDSQDRPILLYVTSGGYESGPTNDPRVWTVACWTGGEWLFRDITSSDNNYDFGELALVSDDQWRLIAPTESGPQPYNPGGEVAMWRSEDAGRTWQKQKQLTNNSRHNHTYVRLSQQGHSDFIAFWADGHGRQPSDASLFFCNADGVVFQLPRTMDSEFATPMPIVSSTNK
ncbi:MAG: BNR-4 repeat-containing protein [Planctomycetales bacterium]|nr:BNR-4 repeat-containing protein [Planctomycetales bacterium]